MNKLWLLTKVNLLTFFDIGKAINTKGVKEKRQVLSKILLILLAFTLPENKTKAITIIIPILIYIITTPDILKVFLLPAPSSYPWNLLQVLYLRIL